MSKYLFFISLLTAGLLYSCSSKEEKFPLPGRHDIVDGKTVYSSRNAKLPVLGNRDTVDGKLVHHRISDFEFIDQDSNKITNQTFKDKIYVVDVFFTSCPTICPKVKKQMLRIYDKYRADDRVSLISHSIDTRRDSVPRLKDYANKLEIDSEKWHLVTGDKEKIYDMADEYFLVALEDPSAEGGYDHSGTVILVDQNRMVRAYANGLIPEQIDRFMEDMDRLLLDNSIPE